MYIFGLKKNTFGIKPRLPPVVSQIFSFMGAKSKNSQSKKKPYQNLCYFSACSSYEKFFHQLTLKERIGFSGKKGRNELAR